MATSKIKYHSDNQGLTIDLGNNLRKGVKLLFVIQCILFVIAAIGFLSFTWREESLQAGVYIFFILIFFVLLFVAFKYLNRASGKEIIFVSKHFLKITKKNLFQTTEDNFEISKISHFAPLKPIKYPSHPLKGDSFDYLGFQTTDTEIQTLNENGFISFFYDGRTVQFGKDLVSWEILEVIDKIKEYASDSFNYNDSYKGEIIG